MGNKIVLVIGVALAVFLASELISLHRENARLREEAKFAVNDSITKGGVTKEDWKKIDELTGGQSDPALKPQGFEAEEPKKTTTENTGRKEEQARNKPVQQGPETPQQKLERLGFSPTEVYQISTKTQKKGE